MADFGLQGTPGGAGRTPEWVDRMRRVLEPLPPVFSTVWLSDHLQQDGEPWPEGWTRLAYLAALDLTVSLHASLERGLRCGVWLMVVFPTLHLSYGIGYLSGLLNCFVLRRRQSSRSVTLRISR